MTRIEFQGVHRAYATSRDVLSGVTFSADAGEVIGLLGRNGAGKTTLLRTALGLLEPQQGRVRVLGLDPRRAAVQIKQRTGYVSEDQILPGHLRVRQILDLHRELYPTWSDESAGRLIEKFDLQLGTRVRTLSKGQARQVALLCAIAHGPDLLLLDEPAGGLDPAARRDFLETSIQLLSERGTTILFSSHYMSDVERLADRILMLHDGRVLIDTGLDELRESYSLALVPPAAGLSDADLLAVEGCLAVRRKGEMQRAVFAFEPDRAAAILRKRARLDQIHCVRCSLEDMFVELAGGAR